MTWNDVRQLLVRIQMEYVEMPELKLTGSQARRLWTLTPEICDVVLGSLVDAGFLTRGLDGTFRRTGARPRFDLVAPGV
jgi:hypothetical protein